MSEQSANIHFLPWLRSGAAAAVGTADALSGPLGANASIEPWVRIEGHVVTHPMRVRGPGHVVGVSAGAIVKCEPQAGTRDFEPNYFPFVEIAPADLPWRYTPAASGAQSRLRPWLVLVVVREQAGVTLRNEPGAPLPVLTLQAPAVASKELPDLADAWAWAHVQSDAPAAELSADAMEDPARAVARLVCPRRLLPRETWHACLVPAFDVGVRAGLGEDGADAEQASPAWDLASVDRAALRLPVYHAWSFSTGAEGDFESLARRLQPDQGAAVLGRVALDVTDPGPPLAARAPAPAVLDAYVGALKSVAVTRAAPPQAHQKALEPELEKLLERGAQRTVVPAAAPAGYAPSKDDPVLAPPLYGSLQAGRTDVPESSDPTRAWMRTLNLQLPLRAAAGLGAAIVRAHQASLVASAWAQAGEARKTSTALDRAALSAEVGRSLARRLVKADSALLVQATRAVHAWIASPASSATLAADLHANALPRGLVSAPFVRATRARTAAGRAFSRRANQGSAPAALATSTFIAATAPRAAVAVRGTLTYAATALPVGAWTRDAALEAASAPPEKKVAASASAPLAQPKAAAAAPKAASPAMKSVAPAGSAAAKPAAAAPAVKPAASTLSRVVAVPAIGSVSFTGTKESAIALDAQLATKVRIPATKKAPAAKPLDMTRAASAVIAGMDPLPRLRSGLTTRIPALAPMLPPGTALPRRLSLAPVFTDPLCWDLVRLDARYLLPGAESLAENRVALLEADNSTVAAIIAGANHEIARELLWREFPASPSNTFFRRFWDTGAGGPDDTGPISAWTKPALDSNLSGVGAGKLAVILVRGDLVRRYPDVRVYACRGVWSGERVVPDAAQIQEVVLQGALDARSNFYGFALASADLRGNRGASARTAQAAGWFIVFEQAASGPRFGLDAAANDGSDLQAGAPDWGALSWDHLVRPKGSLAEITHVYAGRALPQRTKARMAGLEWGRNSAHMAAITWQRPFRLYIHADRLLGAT